MDWKQLLSNVRCPKKLGGGFVAAPREPFRSPFEADYDRVVYSAPFRRLARKTQVHPLALHDHVHTRLTHSLEVASVGRSLGHRLADYLDKKELLPAEVAKQDITWIIQAACLAHDIGNPPFGHAGEFAVREWVSGHEDRAFGDTKDGVSEDAKNDLRLFEGNAQGFRLASRGDNPETGYMRLTFATLGAMVKYPWLSSDPRAKDKKKFNVFNTERELFSEMADTMGLKLSDGTIARHPLSFITEAADDICYRILDVEDAVAMKIVDETVVKKIYLSTLDSLPTSDEPLAQLRGKAIEALLNGAWDVFQGDYVSIMDGKRTNDLKKDFPVKLTRALTSISDLYKEKIFADRMKVAIEIGAYKTLGRIAKALLQATLELSRKKNIDEISFLNKRCLELAWGEGYAVRHAKRQYEWWLYQVMDYVSGLTDRYARQISREIEGT